MKTKITLALIFFALLSGLMILPSGCKKSNNNEPTPVPGKKKYAWVVGTKDSTGYAMILNTRDGGQTWQRQGQGQVTLKGIDLMDVWAIDTATVWAVGSGNTILRTTDGGSTWSKITPPLPGTAILLSSLAIPSKENIWISGGPGAVYHSLNGGENWEAMDTNFLHHWFIQGIHVTGTGEIYGDGNNGEPDTRGVIIHSASGGLMWDTLSLPGTDVNQVIWIGVKSSGPEIVIYGGRSHYLASADAGSTWRFDSVPGTGGTNGADINCLTMLDAMTWWGAFDYDGIFISSNTGISWTKQTSPPPAGMWLFGIDYYDRYNAIIVGQSSMSNRGKILTTTDGTTWTLTYLSNCWLNKVSFIRN
ncbi:MAG TPA: YCF48-related protein [Bacteroidales bacterium]|nr:YCF48-related protein [Bacteroidales bacterium]